ncbi:MAG: PAS domain S-box protein [Aggregatilineales bacterium]
MNMQIRQHFQSIMRSHNPPTIFHYVNSVLITVIALALTAAFWDIMRDTPFLFFIAAVVLSAWYGGLWAGLLSGILSILLADYFLLEPLYQLFTSWAELIQFAIFSFVAVMISWIENNRRRSLDELNQVNAQLQAIIDGVADGITAQNQNGDVLFANEAAAKLTRESDKRELTKKNLIELQQKFELFDIDGNALPYDALPRNIVFKEKKKSSLVFRQRYVNSDDETWTSLHSAPVFDKAGKVVMAVNIFRDITEQFKLNQERAQLAAIVNNSQDAIISKSLDGIIMTWNPGAEGLYGYPADEALGQPIAILFPENIKEHEIRLRARVQEGERIHNYETTRQRKDGELIEISLTISPVRDERGQIKGFSTIERDITDRKRHQAEITRLTLLTQAQHNRLMNIVASVPGMVYESTITSETGQQRMDFISNYAESLFGYTLEEWNANDNLWEQIVLEEEWESIGKQATVIYESKEPGTIQFRCRTKTGEIIYAESHTTFIDNEDGTVLSRGVIMDVTERKHLDDMLQAYTEDLRRSNEELEQFAYVASHDLQEPLRMVTSYLQLVEKRYAENLDEDARVFIGFAVDGASRMKQLISDLLVYSRVQRNKEEMKIVSMETVVSQVLDNLRMSIEETNAIITFDSLPEITVNDRQMTQLFQNLISNALKFRGDASPSITINAKEDKGNWIFSIQDNGIGIEKEHQERIFVIFQRLHTREKYEGTGIGLAICRKIVDKHGGRIWVESEVGMGTTFFFSIPVKTTRRQLYGSY